jgi:uncharacterized cupredoxin-like copper-binding protein
MRLSRVLIAAPIVVVVAACSAAATPTSLSPSVSPTVRATHPVGSPSPSAQTLHVQVKLTDGLNIEPAALAVPAGRPVTFVVTNVGAVDHEFYLGDEAAQAEHDKEMASMGGMLHDEPEGIAVKPGQTKELRYTFDAPGATLAGCHLPGHYAAGMKATITVE